MNGFERFIEGWRFPWYINGTDKDNLVHFISLNMISFKTHFSFTNSQQSDSSNLRGWFNFGLHLSFYLHGIIILLRYESSDVYFMVPQRLVM